MCRYRSIKEKNASFKAFVESEDKDYIIDKLLINADENSVSTLLYSELKDINISKGQFESIINEFVKDNLIERHGYGDKFKILSNMYKKREFGGYCMERDAYIAGLGNLQLQLEKVNKELNPTAIDKINNIVNDMKSMNDLILGIGSISNIIRQFLPPQ